MSITLSEVAAREVKRVIEENSKEGMFTPETAKLRVGVRGGGCSGFTYTLDLTGEDKGESDEVLDSHGVKILVDNKSLLYLSGTEIDFRDEMMGRGFVFKNPNATSTCGCGSSFTA